MWSTEISVESYAHLASRYHARDFCFYTVIITLNDSLFKLILCRLLAAGCAATKYGVLYYQ